MNIKREIFEFIVDNKTRWNILPTRSEVCKIFSSRSDDIALHLEQLQREGLLELEPDGGESISIPPTYDQLPPLKVRGVRPANRPSLTQGATKGCIGLDLRGLGVPMEANMYAILVSDDSMSDAGISEGDIAILHQRPAGRGDVVAVELDGEVALRRFIILAKIPHLLAENPRRPDLCCACEISLEGVLWGLVRMEPSRRKSSARPPSKVHYPHGSLSVEQNTSPLHSDYLMAARAHFEQPPERPDKKTDILVQQKDWPKSPSGVELNDMANQEYRTDPELHSSEVPVYGGALESALRRYEQEELAHKKRTRVKRR